MTGLELLPLVEGAGLGLLLARARPAARLWAGTTTAIPLGALAALATGQLAESWSFILVDGALVGVAAAAALAAVHRWGRDRDAGAAERVR